MRDWRLTEFAKQMRSEMTGPEMKLWLSLRAKRFEGVKFRRQKVIGRYIADFASNVPKLIIELDGDTHADRQEQDAARTAYLEERGYRVIRFINHDVMSNLEGVLTQIGLEVQPSPLPTLSPEGERA